MICAEHSRCETNNDTIVSTYYDNQGRLIELWRRDDNYGEAYTYTDSSVWETKRTITTDKAVTYDVAYAINDKDKILTEYTIEGGDTVNVLEYRYDENGQVVKYGPDKDGLLHYLNYNQDGLAVKMTVQYPDTATYLKKFGPAELYHAYKTEEVYEYYDGHLNVSTIKYYDVHGNKFFEPVTFKYRYDGLMESINGQFRYIFSYGK